ncbi:MAG: hypothetical protein GY698_24180 [Actinomycetia bacterium]|nr:hypothetical protein [Actinomycetes bacterium]
MGDVVLSGPTRPAHRRRRPSGEPPPLPHSLNKPAIAWLAGFFGWAAIWAWVFFSDGPAVWITERDLELMAPIVDNRTDWLTPTMRTINKIGTHWATPVVGWTTLLGALAARRIRHAMLLITSLSVIAFVVTMVTRQIDRPRPLGMTQIGDWEGFAQPSRPIALLTGSLVAAGLTLLPGGSRRRTWFLGATVVIGIFGLAQLYTGVDHPTDIIAGATVGVATCLLAYRTFAPEAVFPITYQGGNTAHLDVTGSRGEAIRRAMSQQLGVDVAEVTPVGLEGSAGSTPLCITGQDGVALFAKLYASSHLRSDRSYKLGRTLLYGRLEDEQRYNSVRRLIQHEDYMLHVIRAAGVDCQEPFGIVEMTPDREYLLVTEFLEGGVEISEAEITEELVDQGLEIIRRLWRAGLAHRDIKPSNIMVQGDQLRIIDVAFAQIRPSPWREAVDLANMMLVLALGTSPEMVYERALLKFSEEEIAEAFAASRGVTLPSQLRRGVRRDGRELLVRFRELAPDREPVAIQRWSLRRLGLTLWVGLLAAFLIALFVGNLADIGLV